MREVEILNHWKKSRKALHSAKTLLREGCLEDAVSRAYYAVFHAAQSVLLFHNVIVTKSHKAVINQFGLKLIKSGEIENEWGRILSVEYDLRISSDYDELYWVESEEAERLIQNAERFIVRMAQYIKSKGFELE